MTANRLRMGGACENREPRFGQIIKPPISWLKSGYPADLAIAGVGSVAPANERLAWAESYTGKSYRLIQVLAGFDSDLIRDGS